MVFITVGEQVKDDLHQIGTALFIYDRETMKPDNVKTFEVDSIPNGYIDEDDNRYSFNQYFNVKTGKFEVLRERRPISQEERIDDALIRVDTKLTTANERWAYNHEEEENIEVLKALKIEQLKELCTASIYEGFESKTLGESFGFNEHDQSNFTQQLLMIVATGGNYDKPVQWKTKSGKVITMTASDFITLIGEAEAHKREKQTKYWTLEALVNKAENKEQVVIIVW